MSLDYFSSSYQTGTDAWSSIPFTNDILSLLSVVPQGGFILDIGCGRGRASLELAKHGYKVIGIDALDLPIKKANEAADDMKLSERAKFFTMDATKLDFEDNSFDAVLCVGLLQHLSEQDRTSVLSEAKRVIRDNGHFLSVELSRETKLFLDFRPVMSSDGKFSRFGLDYHFFTNNEMLLALAPYFDIESQITGRFKTKAYGADELDFLFTLGRDSNPRNESISPLVAVFEE